MLSTKARASLALLGLAAPASAAVEFVGTVGNGPNALLAVTDTETRAASWVRVGENFQGFVLVKYDSANERARFVRGSEILDLDLKDSRVQAAPEVLKGVLRYTVRNTSSRRSVTLVFGRRNTLDLSPSYSISIFPKKMPGGEVLYSTFLVRKEMFGESTVIASPTLIVSAGEKVQIDVTEYQIEFEPSGA